MTRRQNPKDPCPRARKRNSKTHQQQHYQPNNQPNNQQLTQEGWKEGKNETAGGFSSTLVVILRTGA
ncbi:hypothetical protein M0802_006118 [Mischocyttarus mexicanus]|nr:hypothetical protein M0802_006118 [Mischocyttarus mexicanus]